MNPELLEELANKIVRALMPRVIEDSFDLGYKAALNRVSLFLTEDLKDEYVKDLLE